MTVTFEEIREFASECFDTADVGATAIQFSESELLTKNSEVRRIRASLIGDDPDFGELATGYGISAWAVILSVDMRNSSSRAVNVGAKSTYLTMHTYLPTMAELVSRFDGKIVGLRGDGLFAAFGITKLTGKTYSEVSQATSDKAIGDATNCAKSMHEAVEEIINPLLESKGVEAGVQIGTVIAVGRTVITRIGLHNANELTAYGSPINQACKKRTFGILLTPGAKELYPTAKGWRARFTQSSEGFELHYPSDIVVLERPRSYLPKKKPH